MRSVCTMLCFSPDGSKVQAVPRQTPCMDRSAAIASRCAAINGAGSGRPWAKAARGAKAAPSDSTATMAVTDSFTAILFKGFVGRRASGTKPARQDIIVLNR